MSEQKTEIYQVHLVYKDGKDLSIEVNDFKEFFKQINAHEIFWFGDEEKAKLGYWINLSEVRLIQIKLVEEGAAPIAAIAEEITE